MRKPQTVIASLVMVAPLVIAAACGRDEASPETAVLTTLAPEQVVPAPAPAAPARSAPAAPAAADLPTVEVKQEPQPLTDQILTDFGAYVEATREFYNVPGTAVVIVQGGEVVYAEGFGIREIGGDDPVTPETIFSIASLNKALTSTMLASLVDEETISWDTPIVEFIPEFRLADEGASQQITLRQGLNHTSGVSGIVDVFLFGTGVEPETAIEFLADIPVQTPPGESYEYENQINALGAYMAAVASGAEYGNNLVDVYGELMQSRVFDPIGMESATFSIETAQASGNFATPHFASINGSIGETGFTFTPTNYWDMQALNPVGGVRANALDMGRYLITLLGNGATPDGTQIASPESLMETWTPQIEKNPAPDVFLESASYGMGWNIVSYQGVELMTHDGNLGGFTSRMGFIPDADIGIVVLSNADVGTALVRDVHYRLIELALGLDPLIEEFAQADYEGIAGLGGLFGQLQPVDPEVIAPFLGSYESIGSPWVVELRGESLRVSRGTVDTVELLAAPDGSYVAISGADFLLQPFSFSQAEDGSISLNIFGAFDFPKLAAGD